VDGIGAAGYVATQIAIEPHIAGQPRRELAFCGHEQLPLDRNQAVGMLMVVLGRQGMLLGDANLMTTSNAAVDPSAVMCAARRKSTTRIKSDTVILVQVLRVLVSSH